MIEKEFEPKPESVREYPPVDISKSKFGPLGLNEKLLQGLAAQKILEPTGVQKAVIPRLLRKDNIVMAASTGSGKTLAFALPVIQSLQNEELQGYQRMAKRPRCLILVPTRELARQVLDAIKSVGHFSKVSSAAIVGGADYSRQKQSLDRMVDIVVASPGRLLQHREQGNVYFSHVNTIIVDEVDTMLTQGFGGDIRGILRNVFSRVEKTASTDAEKTESKSKNQIQVVMATATLTKAVRVLLDDMENGGFNIEYSDPSNKTPRKIDGTEQRIAMNIVEVDGLHRILPNVQHLFEDTKGVDKLTLLKTALTRMKNKRILVFCNTIDSCRAVDHAINEEDKFKTLCYHGDMNSLERQSNMDAFRKGEENILVCTDIAARGIDIPDVDNVIMFDFPMNPIDYIHRAGRCGRAGRKGCVTSLVSKRDEVLSAAIQNCIKKGLPIDSLTASKRDYMDGGKLAHIAGRSSIRPMKKYSPRDSQQGKASKFGDKERSSTKGEGRKQAQNDAVKNRRGAARFATLPSASSRSRNHSRSFKR
jgi:superfamily II DNA/RNA helicase